MGDYVPVFAPGDDITQTAGGVITGGQLVSLSAANTVVATAAATAAWLGVATTDAASGARVGVTSGGVQEVKCSAAIAVGDPVIPASAGRVAPIAAVTNYAQQVGVALTSTSAADQTLLVKFVR